MNTENIMSADKHQIHQIDIRNADNSVDVLELRLVGYCLYAKYVSSTPDYLLRLIAERREAHEQLNGNLSGWDEDEAKWLLLGDFKLGDNGELAMVIMQQLLAKLPVSERAGRAASSPVDQTNAGNQERS